MNEVASPIREPSAQRVEIPAGRVDLQGELILPADATTLVLFAHGSGSSRHSPRNQYVARIIRERGIGTLLFDLLTCEEEEVDAMTRHLRFDINLLAGRLEAATRWILSQAETRDLAVGYFGASTGAAAALIAAAELGPAIGAVVSRGGRPDLAAGHLARVQAPTLLIVGSLDDLVIRLNEQAYKQLHCRKRMEIIRGASHLFEEPGTLEAVARLAANWLQEHLGNARGKADYSSPGPTSVTRQRQG